MGHHRQRRARRSDRFVSSTSSFLVSRLQLTSTFYTNSAAQALPASTGGDGGSWNSGDGQLTQTKSATSAAAGATKSSSGSSSGGTSAGSKRWDLSVAAGLVMGAVGVAVVAL